MTSTRETAAFMFGNPSGIPPLLDLAAVRRPRCIDCKSLNTWTLPTAAPFTYRPMLNRLCDDCGRVTGAYTDTEEDRHGEDQRRGPARTRP